MMQTFFCLDTATGQPLVFMLSASEKTCSQDTVQLLDMAGKVMGQQKALVLADKEHFTRQIADYFDGSHAMDILMPASGLKGINERITGLDFRELWPGYSVAETTFSFHGSARELRLISQRESVAGNRDDYKAFLTSSDKDAGELISKVYSKRWTTEEFFNFEGTWAGTGLPPSISM